MTSTVSSRFRLCRTRSPGPFLTKSAILLAVLLSLVPPRGAHGQSVSDELAREFVNSWLIVVGGELRSRVLDVRELAVRADGGYLLDAKYGWTIGGTTVPVRAELYGASGNYTLSVITPTGSVIVSKQIGPVSFAGTFTISSGSRTTAVEIKRASTDDIRARIDYELQEYGKGDGFALENKDWGIAATDTLKIDRPHAPTPRTINGIKTITTLELYRSLQNETRPVLVDVLDGRHESIRGAHWLPKGGSTNVQAEQQKFAAALDKLTGGDKAKQLVFFCLNSECWLSYNAALQARTLGFKAVAWYRGGTAAWRAADFPKAMVTKEAW